MQSAFEYLKNTYDPVAMILYGSYAEGTMDQNSDLDILVVVKDGADRHDMSVVDGIALDAFVVNREKLNEIDPADYIQLYDGKVIFQSEFDGNALIGQVRNYVHDQPKKTNDQIIADIQWCEKMLERAKRSDPEGFYRWHWVLTESLQIFCDIKGRFYFGPKKTIRWMKDNCPESYEVYCSALTKPELSALEAWIGHLRTCFR